jgi:hypothetical protein
VKGFETDPVQEIRRILHDSYGADSVLKELIQNADDAGARTLHLGWTTDWPEGMHPLLSGPVLLILNDGVFREKDAEAILRLDIGAKGGDIAAIGKYGLGMKSLFHHCEGFFYLASANQPISSGSRVEFVTPWARRANRQIWSDHAEAEEELLRRIHSWPHECSSWFCLAIPLRRSEHEVDGQALVSGTYPEVGDVLEKLATIGIAELMPMLRHLQSVSVWDWQDGALRSQSEITLNDAPLRLSFPEIHPGGHRSVRGAVLVKEEGRRLPTEVWFAGCEALLDDDAFSDLKARDDWPQNVSLVGEAQDPEDRPEKAAPHCAVLFSRTCPTEQKSEIRPAVFLPVSAPTWEIGAPETGERLQILLHGYFFLDAGRQRVVLDDAGNGVEAEWNRRLFETGVLPLVVFALHDFVLSAELPAQAVERLTTAIQDSSFFGEYSPHICKDRQWVYRISHRDLRLSGGWCLVETSPVLELPPPPGDGLDFLLRILPGLHEVCARSVVTLSDKPRLTSAPVPALWNSRALQELLSSIPEECFAEEQTLLYLAVLLESLGQLDPSTQTCLLSKVKSQVAREGRGILANCASAFQRFVGSLDPNTWVSLGSVDQASERVICDLNGLDLTHLILSDSLSPHEHSGRMDATEAERVLRWLSTVDSSRNIVGVSAIALRVIESTSGTREERLQCLGTYAVIAVRNARGGDAPHLESWGQLAKDFARDRLFASRSELLPVLQKSLRDEVIHSLVEPAGIRPFDVLFGCEPPPTCSRHACLKKLNEAPALAGPDSRRALLVRLRSGDQALSDQRDRRALRYLLHANRQAVDDRDTYLVARTSTSVGGGVSQLATAALRVLNEEWRYVSDDLCGELNPNQRSWLGVGDLDSEVLAQILARVDEGGHGYEWVGDLGLTSEEAEAVLVAIADERLWRILPLHRCVAPNESGGHYASLVGLPCYLGSNGDRAVPGVLRNRIRIIQRPEDLRLLQRYNAGGVLEWSPITQLRELLELPDPSDNASDILAILGAISQNQSIPQDLLRKLRETKWLPFTRGRKCPSEVVDLPDMESLLSGCLGTAWQAGVFSTVQDFPLLTSAANSSSLGLLRSRQILPPLTQSLKLLGRCLGQIPDYRVGRVRQIIDDPSRLSQVVTVLRHSEELPPGYAVLVDLCGRVADRIVEIQTELLPELLHDAPVDTAIVCLTAASDAAQRRVHGAGQVLQWYIEFLTEHSGFELAHLSGQSFPSLAGHWVTAEELSFEAEGVDPAVILDSEIALAFPERLRQQPSSHPHATTEEVPLPDNEACDVLEYFEHWRTLVGREVVGGFLCFMGDDPSLVEAAEVAIHPRSVEGIRNQVRWRTHDGSIMAGADEDIHTVMGKQRFRIRLAEDGSTVKIRNLMGEMFQAPVGRPTTSVFVGDLFGRSPGDGIQNGLRTKTLTLRAFDPASLQESQLQQILLDSLVLLFRKVYHRDGGGLHEIWEDLIQPDQLRLEIAQDMLLEHAWPYLEMVGCRRMGSLRDLLREYEQLTDRKTEHRHFGQSEALAAVEEELVELRHELQTRLESDPLPQTDTLQGIRAKMMTYEYDSSSTPFELFQNADDSISELIEMDPLSGHHPQTNRFNVTWRESTSPDADATFQVMHWGRPIGEFQRGDSVAEDGRSKGYHADLRKMLLMSSSDKGEREELVTGRFGLGFKTALFVCDQPRVLSKDLAFKVVGGFYPLQPHETETETLAGELARACPDRRDGTVILLPVPPDLKTAALKSLEAFAASVPLLLCFSRRIKDVSIELPSGISRYWWSEKSLSDVTRVTVGHSQMTSDDRQSSSQRFLVFRDQENGALVLGLDSHGVAKLETSFSTFWVTAPTRTHVGQGFAVNADFNIDVGRTQLADSEANCDVAHSLGRAVGPSLVELYGCSLSRWEDLRSDLGLSPNVRNVDFWRSFWSVIAEYRFGDDPRLRSLLWARDSGLGLLSSECDVLPTQLCGPFSGETQIGKLKGVVKGILDSDDDAFLRVAALDVLRNRYEPGSILSNQRAAGILQWCFAEERGLLENITLLGLLQQLVGQDRRVDPRGVPTLSSLVTPDRLRAWRAERGESRAEALEIDEFLGTLQFQTIAETWSTANGLLCDSGQDDESMRAAFAPDGCVLDASYGHEAIDFFRACRGDMRAPTTMLADWVLAVETDSRTAALRYLLDGELGRDVAVQLRPRVMSTWLDDLTLQDLALRGFSDHEQTILLILLGANQDDMREHLGGSISISPIVELREIDTGKALAAISEWWRQEGEAQTHAYELRLYPGGVFPLRGFEDEEANREGWLSLFLLACAQTLGRTTMEQGRNFLELSRNHGWLDRMTQADRIPEVLTGCWTEFVGGQVDRIAYYRWILQLVGLSVVATWLDEYTDAWLAVRHVTREFDLEQISNPRSSEFFAGGGPDAPPLSPILGIGQCFLMRELMRNGIVASTFATRWCYPPVARLRRLVQALGGPVRSNERERTWQFSVDIYDFLSDHLPDPTFSGAFDIPLLIVADNDELRERFLGTGSEFDSPFGEDD